MHVHWLEGHHVLLNALWLGLVIHCLLLPLRGGLGLWLKHLLHLVVLGGGELLAGRGVEHPWRATSVDG